MSSASSYDQRLVVFEEKLNEVIARLDHLEDFLESLNNESWEEENLCGAMDECEYGEVPPD